VGTLTAEPSPQTDSSARRRRSIVLVTVCTIIGAVAQLLIKTGAGSLVHVSGLLPNLMAMATNLPLAVGYMMYGCSAVLMVVALKDAELSLLYPIIALTYVWVSILSVAVLHEKMNLFKVVGISIIVVGVAVIGLGGKS
jgi:multidrug transporter EmrE-like cation transporter